MNPLQTFLLAALDKILSNLPAIIASVGAIWVGVHHANKKTVETANETNNKLDKVHDQVNGNFTALQAKNDALAIENEALRGQIKRRKRKTDP